MGHSFKVGINSIINKNGQCAGLDTVASCMCSHFLFPLDTIYVNELSLSRTRPCRYQSRRFQVSIHLRVFPRRKWTLILKSMTIEVALENLLTQSFDWTPAKSSSNSLTPRHVHLYLTYSIVASFSHCTIKIASLAHDDGAATAR